MRRRAVLGVAALVLLLFVAALLLDPAVNRPTARSPLPAGYRAAFAYLEARGYPVAAWQRPADELDDDAALLVTAGPFARGVSAQELAALETWLRRGGTLLYLPSGHGSAIAENIFRVQLGLPLEEIDQAEPIGWKAWRDWRLSTRTLRRVDEPGIALPGAPETLSAAQASVAVNQPGGAQTLYVDDEGAPLAFALPRGEGRILVVNDASIFSNALIESSGNLELLESVAAASLSGSGTLYFDEWRQGYADPGQGGVASTGAFEIFVLHLAVIYLATLWALGRRFGPRMEEPELVRGSLTRDLRAIAALHRRSGHAAASGALMLARTRQLGRGRAGLAELPETFEGGEKELEALAARIARLQEEGRL